MGISLDKRGSQVKRQSSKKEKRKKKSWTAFKTGRAPLECQTTGSNSPDNSNEAVRVPETSEFLSIPS